MAGGLLSILSGVGSAAAGYQLADDLRATGESAASQMGTLGGQLQSDAAFKGYGVQTGLGTSTVGANGSTNLGVGLDQGMMSQMGQFNQMGQGFGGYANQAAQNAMGDTGAREQDIYNRAMAMQQPGLDAQQAQQQAREFAMGRGGVRGSQFGGTAEDAAMAKAQVGAQNQAAFQAMGQAQTEMMNQGQLASQFGQVGQGYGGLGLNAYQQSYMPMQQQLNAMQVAQGNAGMAQTGQLTGTGYGAQLGLGGIQAQVNADKSASELYGNMFGAGMQAIGSASGMFGEAGANAPWYEKLASWL